MNLSPFSNQLLLLSQKKVRHFDFTLMRTPYTYIFGFISVFFKLVSKLYKNATISRIRIAVDLFDHSFCSLW
jgi:hypothetical protein